MIGLIQLLLASLILLAAMPVVLGRLVFTQQRKRVGVALSFLVGACASGILVWNLVPADWNLSFWLTVEASAKYGHEIEHTAENILAMCVFACAAGGIVSAGTSMLVARFKHS